MHCTRRQRMIAAFSLACAAVALTVVFTVLAIRRKSVWEALFAVVTAGSAGAALLLLHEERRDAADDAVADEELFEGDAVEEAMRRVRETLAGENAEAAE